MNYMSRYTPGTNEADLAGTDLADGFFGVLWAIAGDLDYLAKTLSLPRWSLAVGCCILCKCEKNGPLTWQDCRLNASWTQTLWTAVAWQAFANRSRNRLFSLPGVTALTVALDYMHSKYLGSDQYLTLPLELRVFVNGVSLWFLISTNSVRVPLRRKKVRICAIPFGKRGVAKHSQGEPCSSVAIYCALL